MEILLGKVEVIRNYNACCNYEETLESFFLIISGKLVKTERKNRKKTSKNYKKIFCTNLKKNILLKNLRCFHGNI